MKDGKKQALKTLIKSITYDSPLKPPVKSITYARKEKGDRSPLFRGSSFSLD